MRDKFLSDESGAITADWVVLTTATVGLAILAGASVHTASMGLSSSVSASLGVDGQGDAQSVPRGEPDIVMPARRLPLAPDHPTLWANPLHISGLPEDFPVIGGRDFTIVGDGNPRLLVAGADPRVVSGDANPQFDMSNYAGRGVAYGDSAFHRILIDRPPPNTTYTVQLAVDGHVIEYSFTNIPY